MTGTVPHNEKRPHDPAPARDVHAAMPFRRPLAHLRRPLHAAPARPTARPTHETAGHQEPSQDISPIEPVAVGQGLPNQPTQASGLQILNRAWRLTFDALMLFIFAPVIAIWWLNKRRNKR